MTLCDDRLNALAGSLTYHQRKVLLEMLAGETRFYAPHANRLCFKNSRRPALLLSNRAGGYGFTPVGLDVAAALRALALKSGEGKA